LDAVKTNRAEQKMIISDMAGDKDASDKAATAGENKVECVSSFVGTLLHKLTPTNQKNYLVLLSSAISTWILKSPTITTSSPMLIENE